MHKDYLQIPILEGVNTMSTTANPTAQAAPELGIGNVNKFDFVNSTGDVKVTYYPVAPGPPRQGQPQGPLFTYQSPEGELTFRGAEVAKEQTPMGTLLSVLVQSHSLVSSTTFSLFLPPVAIGSTKSQIFTTYAIKTTDRKSRYSPQGRRSLIRWSISKEPLKHSLPL